MLQMMNFCQKGIGEKDWGIDPEIEFCKEAENGREVLELLGKRGLTLW